MIPYSQTIFIASASDNDNSEMGLYSRTISIAHTKAYPLASELAYIISDLGLYPRSITSTHTNVIPIALIAGNHLS